MLYLQAVKPYKHNLLNRYSMFNELCILAGERFQFKLTSVIVSCEMLVFTWKSVDNSGVKEPQYTWFIKLNGITDGTEFIWSVCLICFF